MNNDFLELGKIVNTHALKGEVKVTPWCDDSGVFAEIKYVYVNDRPIDIEKAKDYKNSVLLKLKGIDSIEQAELLKNAVLYAERKQLGELPEDTYYIKDLIGLEVYEGDGFLGILEDCFPTGGNDVYVVKNSEGKQLLLPAIKQVVKKVDLNLRRMEVELLEGMEDED